MTLVTSSELAALLTVTPTRVGQYVREGKLDGCFTGDGRARRFDVAKVGNALGRNLHPGQMLGNGAPTRQAIADLKVLAPMASTHQPAWGIPAATLGDAGAVDMPDGKGSGADHARYDMARIEKVEAEARRLRRLNAEAEGTFVLASEVTRSVARLVSQEVAEFEASLRDGARAVADRLGVDFKEVRGIMIEAWRTHRSKRSAVQASQADSAEMSDDEKAEDI